MNHEPAKLEAEKVREAMRAGCEWIQNVAQLKTDELPPDTDDRRGFGYQRWRGVIRGEYSAATRKWWFGCPVWHTGQAVKALVLASKRLNAPGLMEGAQAGATFVYNQQVWDESDPDHGLLLAFEDLPDQVNTSATMEAMDGLMLLANELNSNSMWERIVAAGNFLVDRMFMPELGVFRDLYHPTERHLGPTTIFATKNNIGGRPLLEDAVLLKLYDRTRANKFLEAHLKVSDRLIADQNPPGNWIDYGPCDAAKSRFHPRHTYWWGLPLIETYRRTGREECLRTAISSGEFCRRAMRTDGGYMRGTYLDFRTDSFGHATSGSACAGILFMRLFEETREWKWWDAATTALRFCMQVQLRDAEDPNLKGAVLEKVLPPDGTDRSPYHLRDLGTIFFVIAGTHYLDLLETL